MKGAFRGNVGQRKRFYPCDLNFGLSKKNVYFSFSVVLNCCVVLLVEKGGDAFDGLTFKLMLTLNITRTIFFFDDLFCQQPNIFRGVIQHRFNSGKVN